MELVKPIIFKEPYEVDRRLAEIQLDRKLLLKCRDIALGSAAEATPFHPSNAAGTFAYHHGTWALRVNFVTNKSNWLADRTNGVESIMNHDLKIMVIFTNVDTACNDFQQPKPRSRKGTGSEEACSGNLFDYLPEYVPVQKGYVTFYLMISENGAAELTRPVIGNGTFIAWPERIYLSDGNDFDAVISDFDNDDMMSDFDPKVARKG